MTVIKEKIIWKDFTSIIKCSVLEVAIMTSTDNSLSHGHTVKPNSKEAK